MRNKGFTTIIFKGYAITRHAEGWFVDMQTFKTAYEARRRVLQLIS
jgi:hypothetical protein